MEDFVLRFMAATFYVMIGRAILVWELDKFATAMEQLSRATVEDLVGAMIAIGVITVVALLI